MIDRAFSSFFSHKGNEKRGTSFSFPSVFGFGTGSGINVTESQALTLPAFYNAVDQITNDVAKLPKSAYRKQDGDRNKLTSHPVTFLIDREPNSLMTAFMFWKVLVQCAILKGNGLAKIIRNSATGALVSLELVDNNDLRDIILVDGVIWYSLKDGWYSQDEIFHITGWSSNGVVGQGVISYAAAELGIAIKAQGFKSEGFDNRGVGFGALETDLPVLSENKRALESAVESKLNSSNGRIKTVLLDEGFKWKNIAVTNAEAELIATGKVSVVDICRFLNISPHKVKAVENLNYSSLDLLNIEHASDSILPWSIKIQQECDRKLFNPKEKADHYVKFNDSILLRADQKTKGEYYSKIVQSGIASRNEIRAWEDMNKVDGLDEHLTPVNTYTQSQLDASLKKIITDGKE